MNEEVGEGAPNPVHEVLRDHTVRHGEVAGLIEVEGGVAHAGAARVVALHLSVADPRRGRTSRRLRRTSTSDPASSPRLTAA